MIISGISKPVEFKAIKFNGKNKKDVIEFFKQCSGAVDEGYGETYDGGPLHLYTKRGEFAITMVPKRGGT